MRIAAVTAEAPVIVGGGPAGAVAALRLARAGIRAQLFERSSTPEDMVCGGFLSWRTLDTLARLGVRDLPGHRVTRMRLFAGDAMVERPLPAPALGISRRTLDRLLLEHAGAAGAKVERGAHARWWNDGRLQVGDRELRPGALFLATGKHELRGLGRPRAAADPAIGLRIRLDATPAVAALIGDAIELYLFDRGYAGLMLHEDGTANLCLAVAKSRLDEAGGPAELLAQLARLPHLDARIAHAALARLDAVAQVPYGWRAREGVHGLFRLGDQAGVIPSLAGEGMGIAIASGARAADAWLRGGAAASPHYQAALSRELRRPIGIASAIVALGTRPGGARTLLAAAMLPGVARLAQHMTRIAPD